MVRSIVIIYAPVNLTAPCIIFSGAQFSLQGGLGPGIETFLGPVKSGSCDLGPKKVEIPGPNPLSVENGLPEKIMHRAVKFKGT